MASVMAWGCHVCPAAFIMKAMDSPGANQPRNPWPFLRLAALVVVILVFGMAGVGPGIRTAGGALILFAALQLLRRFRGSTASCEVSGQLSLRPAMLLAAVQAGAGVVMLVWPAVVLGLLGVEGL
jgi:hypothetical protein